MNNPTKTEDSFEYKIKQLEESVKKIETGALSLEESILVYEKCVSLYKDCRQHLDHTEVKIRTLTDSLKG